MTGLQRWLCLVLSLLRVIISQSKEEVVLSRLEELSLSVCVLKRTPEIVTAQGDAEGVEVLAKELPQGLPPEETIAR